MLGVPCLLRCSGCRLSSDDPGFDPQGRGEERWNHDSDHNDYDDDSDCGCDHGVQQRLLQWLR